MNVKNEVAWSRFSPKLSDRLEEISSRDGTNFDKEHVAIFKLGEKGRIDLLPKSIQQIAVDLKAELVAEHIDWVDDIL